MKIIYIGNKLVNKGFTPTSIETLGPLLESLDFKLLYASDKKNKVVRLLDMLSKIFFTKGVDFVLIDTYSTLSFVYSILCAFFCKLLKIRYIPIVRGGNMNYRIYKSKLLSDFLFLNAYTNVLPSSFLKSIFEKKNYKYALIPNNIDIKNYNFVKRENFSPKFLWVRSFHKIYNPYLAIYFIKHLKSLYPEVKLTMVGPDKDSFTLNDCKNLVNELDLQNSIDFTGNLSKKEWINLSVNYNFFLNTSNYDNMPVSVMEAMALGLIVFSTNVGGIPWLLNHSTNGFIYEKDNINDLINQYKNSLENPQLLSEMSIKARSDIEQYDWSIVKFKWINLFNNV
jgi:glycosyltransferase involved in cell wall biosynthesis